MALSIASRARQAGMSLSPSQILTTPTIAELATAAAETTDVEPSPAAASTSVPLTAFMQRFLRRPPPNNPQYWNISGIVKSRRKLAAGLLEKAFVTMMRRYDAFRLNVFRSEAGWHAKIDDVEDVKARFDVIDLEDQPAHVEAMGAMLTHLHASIRLSNGPIARMVLFELGDAEPQRLFFVVHHFAIEGISWAIFWREFEEIYKMLEREQEPVAGDDRIVSFKRWADDLANFITSEEAVQAAHAWLEKPWPQVTPLATDGPAPTPTMNTNSSAEVHCERLSRDLTKRLSSWAIHGFSTEVILIAALARALSRFQGGRHVFLQRLIHGRNVGYGRLDMTESIGCFVCYASTLIELSDDMSTHSTLDSIKTQIEAQSVAGVSAELIRFMNPDTEQAAALEQLPSAHALFNYRGKIDDLFAQSHLFERSDDDKGSDHDPDGLRDHALSVLAEIIDEQLIVKFVYSSNLHDPETIAAVASDFTTFVTDALAEEITGIDTDA